MASSATHQPPAGRDAIELSRDECLELLRANTFGRLAVNGGADAPVLRPVNYVFDESSQAVVFRTAAGSKFHFLARGTHAAFEIDSVDAKTRTGRSVIIVGLTDEVTNPTDVRRLSTLGLDSWVPGEPAHWIRIRARRVSGRRIVDTGLDAV